jgi:transcriptional regulator with XRE-family HTH domain
VLIFVTFYQLYCDLCKDAGLTPSGAATAIGFNRATVTTWKNTGNTPKGELLSKISKFFDVPTDFLLGLPPFNCWDLINQNRSGFLHYVDTDPGILKLAWGYNFDDPDSIPTRDFISFLAEAIETARPTEEGDWDIKLRPLYQKEKKPTPEGERQQEEWTSSDSARRLKLLARHLDRIPEDTRNRLLTNFEDTIDTYLDAMGISREDG